MNKKKRARFLIGRIYNCTDIFPIYARFSIELFMSQKDHPLYTISVRKKAQKLKEIAPKSRENI